MSDNKSSIPQTLQTLQEGGKLQETWSLGQEFRMLSGRRSEPPHMTASANNKGRIQDMAVRSSVTAEDLPTVSLAGQQETYLNIQGL